MGDSLAVEVAQQAHSNVLSTLCHSMRPKEVIRYRHPISRTPFVEMLAIDDHVGIQKIAIDNKENPSMRDTEVFEATEKAYRQVGLVQHPKKRKRNLTNSIVLGADFDGLSGRVSAPRNRVMLLSLLSLAIVRIRCCTPKILSVLLGCWIHVLLFRRAVFSVIDALF